MKGVDTIYTIEQIKDILSPIFQNYNVQRAILFGSYAKGTPQEKSDIDILVDSGLHGLAFYGLLEDVVTFLEKPVDLIDRSEIVPDSEIDNEIKKNGVLIYGYLRQTGFDQNTQTYNSNHFLLWMLYRF